MKFREGYLCSEEDLDKLPVDILEDIIIHIHKDSYLSRDVRDDLMELYLENRKWKLDKAFLYTEENLQRLRDMNALIERQSTAALETAWQVWQDERAEKALHPESYRDVEITPALKVPATLYADAPGCVFTEKEESVWDVLCSEDNFKYVHFPMLVSSAPFVTRCPRYDLRAVVRHVVYGCQGDEEPTPWGMAGLDWEKIKDICFIWPFHTLFEHCGFAMADILKIEGFNLEIELTDEIL